MTGFLCICAVAAMSHSSSDTLFAVLLPIQNRQSYLLKSATYIFSFKVRAQAISKVYFLPNILEYTVAYVSSNGLSLPDTKRRAQTIFASTSATSRSLILQFHFRSVPKASYLRWNICGWSNAHLRNYVLIISEQH